MCAYSAVFVSTRTNLSLFKKKNRLKTCLAIKHSTKGSFEKYILDGRQLQPTQETSQFHGNGDTSKKIYVKIWQTTPAS